MVCLYGALILVQLWVQPGYSHAGEIHTPFTYVVKSGDTLSKIALHHRVSLLQLRRWNSLQADKIFEGQHLKLWPHSPPKWYVVRSGDTLSEIAIRFGIPISSLRRLNKTSEDRIYSGQKLKLHKLRGSVSVPLTHVVRKGDTLWDIAQLYGLSIPDLKQLNDLKSDTITPGMRLNITKLPEEGAPEEEQFEYIVKRGDNLSTIAQRFDVGLNLLRQLNHLKGGLIYPGQRLQLRPSSLDEAVHVVRRGETLSSIALKYRVRLSELVDLNGIEGSKILIGQKLRLKTTPAAIHIVERGDALWEIARAYGMTLKELKRLNGLTMDRIYPGQELKLRLKQSEPIDIYSVRKGDDLGRIARLHQMSVSDLKKMNKLRNSAIYPGDKLKVKPLLQRGREWPKISEINWADMMSSLGGVRRIQTDNGPYYHSRPKADYQKSARYYEGPIQSPFRSYKQARKLWTAFNREVTRLGRLSNALKGWHIVLDPGHGGLDPGTVVENLDGNGNKVYVVEDEYVYDVTLRIYVLLRLHGAEVTMTLLSPNHLIRHSNPPTQTFVNEKNEVYNSHKFNKRNNRKSWPSGGPYGNLLHRVSIARRAFQKIPKNRRIFLSFHADIDPNSTEAPHILYYKSSRGRYLDNASRNFAKALLPALGAGAYTRGQPLAVLKDNPSAIKVMVELRNLAYTDNVWAMRFEQLRHRNAEKVVRGVLDYVRRKTRRSVAQHPGSRVGQLKVRD